MRRIVMRIMAGTAFNRKGGPVIIHFQTIIRASGKIGKTCCTGTILDTDRMVVRECVRAVDYVGSAVGRDRIRCSVEAGRRSSRDIAALCCAVHCRHCRCAVMAAETGQGIGAQCSRGRGAQCGRRVQRISIRRRDGSVPERRTSGYPGSTGEGYGNTDKPIYPWRSYRNRPLNQKNHANSAQLLPLQHSLRRAPLQLLLLQPKSFSLHFSPFLVILRPHKFTELKISPPPAMLFEI